MLERIDVKNARPGSEIWHIRNDLAHESYMIGRNPDRGTNWTYALDCLDNQKKLLREIGITDEKTLRDYLEKTANEKKGSAYDNWIKTKKELVNTLIET